MPEQPPKAPEQFKPLPPAPPAYRQSERPLDPRSQERSLNQYLADQEKYKKPQTEIPQAPFLKDGSDFGKTEVKISQKEIALNHDVIKNFQEALKNQSLTGEEFLLPETDNETQRESFKRRAILLLQEVFDEKDLKEIVHAEIIGISKFDFDVGGYKGKACFRVILKIESVVSKDKNYPFNVMIDLIKQDNELVIMKILLNKKGQIKGFSPQVVND